MFKEEQNTLRVALYIRVSTEEQGDKYGIPLQKEALLALIKSRPGSLVSAGNEHIYIDDGVSGTVPVDERPEFARLKENLSLAPEGQRPFDVVAVYKIDRFARKLKILLDVIDFFEANDIKFLSANESIDTSTPFGKAMLGIIGVIAELERETIKQRTQDGRRQATESGVVMGANAAYGYSKDENKRYKILPSESKVVEQIFHMFVHENKSIDSIAKTLTSLKISSPQASALENKKRKGDLKKKTGLYFWQGERVRYILNDEIYIGNVYSNKFKKGKLTPKSGWLLSPTQAPMIIDLVTFEKARRLLIESKHTKKVAKDGHVYLLSGLLRCDCCYDPKTDVYGRVGWCGERKVLKNDIQYYYKCGRKNQSKNPVVCKSLPLNAKEVEEYIFDFCKKLIKNPLAVFNHQRKLQSNQYTLRHLKLKEKQFIDLLEAIPFRKTNLREQHEGGYIDISALNKSFSTLEAESQRYRKELGDVRKQMSQNILSQGYQDVFEAFAEKYDLMLKSGLKDRVAIYTIFHELIEEITVHTRPLAEEDKIAGIKKEVKKSHLVYI
ncbi:MAG: recombinase family protein [bacterium]